MENPRSHHELLPHLFRQEYAKMTAVLCRHFGLKHIEIAEDIISDTFLKASESWAVNGLPEKPTAWLYTVAKNKARDYFKSRKVFEMQVKESVESNRGTEQNFEFSDENITDSQLAMIFAVCNPVNPPASQTCLALQVLCGFSIVEIANAFLTGKETIKKRLHRARKNLREDDFKIQPLSEKAIKSRLDPVLKTMYLLFNEGYFSGNSNQLIRKELCAEAVRLTLLLTENPLTNTPEANALLALMCFQSSRLEARTNDSGEMVLFEDQDKTLWDKGLIERGNYYLINACEDNKISKYHLEAAIAYWHTTDPGDNKWTHILRLYNRLILIEYSPITALNRVFAFSKVHGSKKAIKEAEQLNQTEISHYHGLLGYLYADIAVDKAVIHYKKAMKLTKSKAEEQLMARKIGELLN